MTPEDPVSKTTGLLGPVAFSGGLFLLAASPLMRGGNRHVALIALELIALGTLLALLLQAPAFAVRAAPYRRWPVLLLALSPLLIALVQLSPLPGEVWAKLPGHDLYPRVLEQVGASTSASRPLSIAPDATAAALLAGLPLSAMLLLGYLCSLPQLRMMLRVVVAVALAEVVLGLVQLAGGDNSPLMLGAFSSAPVGTFGNRNHFANYITMTLYAYLWLAYDGRSAIPAWGERLSPYVRRAAIWLALGLLLVLGVLMSRSRGALLFGLPLAFLGLGFMQSTRGHATWNWRLTAAVGIAVIAIALALIGFEAATSRLTIDDLTSAAGYRGNLARTSLDGALAFWPWGSGWGTYDLAYPRFQPLSITGYANHAHMDYIEMLFEGGIIFVVLAVIFLCLAVQRVALLARLASRRRIDSDSMACILCGLGLLALLLHSLVEFNMRIPANAILGALLAGVFLRPLSLVDAP